MAKTKEQKTQIIEQIALELKEAKSAVLIDYKGLKVKDSEELRTLLRSKGATLSVAKNTLVKIALKKEGISFNEEIFKKPVAIAFSKEDEVAPAKEISLFAKKNQAVEILGGILESKMIDADSVKRLAELPTKEELLAKAVGSIASPLSGMVNVLAGNIRSLVSVLKNIETKLSK